LRQAVQRAQLWPAELGAVPKRIALVVLWRLRYKLSFRDLAEMFLTGGFIFSYEAVRD
jgi:hypothetical protein